MICPTCSSDTRVAESRKLNAKQYRLRRCNEGHVFVTMEAMTTMTTARFRRLDYLNRAQKEMA
jgi:transcriptional regulator NrdR family protein